MNVVLLYMYMHTYMYVPQHLKQIMLHTYFTYNYYYNSLVLLFINQMSIMKFKKNINFRT